LNQSLSMESLEVVLGPDSLEAIDSALDTLMPWISDSKFRIKPDGSFEFSQDEPAEAIELLRNAVEQFLPHALCTHLGQRSGLGWAVFFEHVVAWWLPQRRHVGFLRALVNRAALHDVDLKLHWNQGKQIPAIRVQPTNSALVSGLILGVCSAIFLTKYYYVDSVFAMLIAAAGLVGGRLYQRLVRYRICGDHLCRARLHKARTCPFCGGETH